MRIKVQSIGFGVWCLVFGVWGFGFRVRVQGLELKVWGLGVWGWGSGFREFRRLAVWPGPGEGKAHTHAGSEAGGARALLA